MGKYLVTIYDNEAMWAAAGPEAAEANHQRHQAFAGERIDAVLDVVHLVYTAGHTAADGDELTRPDLARRGIDLARMVRRLLPDSGEATALLALLLLTQARQQARVDGAAQLVLLEDQDRSLWDRSLISEGLALVHEALGGPVGRFGLMAAIAAVHVEAERWEDTDWPEILGLYDLLLARWPSPVVALNRVVALSYVEGPKVALDALADLAGNPTLATYPYLASTRAELLRRTGDWAAAVGAYEEALAFTSNTVEADFLQRRINRGALGPRRGGGRWWRRRSGRSGRGCRRPK